MTARGDAQLEEWNGGRLDECAIIDVILGE